MSLDRIDRKTFFDGLSGVLGIHPWKQSQVDGLNAFLAEAERDPMIPVGKVGLQRCAYWIFTMWIETARTFQPIQEMGGSAYFIRKYGAGTRKGRELGNDTDEEAVAYSGKGLVQITGEYNVEALEKLVRDRYPWIVTAVEASTGRPFDLTIGDQPHDSDDVKNLMRFDVAYVALVAGTTFGMFGPRLDRYINDRQCDYRGARHSVNGVDRAGEFAAMCPAIEKVLRVAAAKRAGIATEPLAPTQPLPDITAGLGDATIAPTPSVGVAATLVGGGAVAVAGGAAVATSGVEISMWVWVIVGLILTGALTVAALWFLGRKESS